MLRRATIIGGALLGVLLFCTPSWAFPGHHPMFHPGGFGFAGRSFPAFGFGASHFGAANFGGPRFGFGSNFNRSNFGIGTHVNGTSFGFGTNFTGPNFGFRPNIFSPRFAGIANQFNTGAVRSYNPTTRTFTTTTPYGTFNSSYGAAPGLVQSYNPATRTALTTTPFGTFASSYNGVNPSQFVSNFARAYSGVGLNRSLWQEARGLAIANGYYPYSYGGYNPYYYGYGYGGYGNNQNSSYGNLYLASAILSSNGYGYGAGSGGYGGAPAGNAGGNAPVGPAGPMVAPAQQQQQQQPSALAAFGIPVEFGEVRWPLALRLMPPNARRDLLDKLQSQMTLAADQSVGGKASVVLLRETKHTIDDARQWLQSRRGNMAEKTYDDGVAFLDRLEDALRRMNL